MRRRCGAFLGAALWATALAVPVVLPAAAAPSGGQSPSVPATVPRPVGGVAPNGSPSDTTTTTTPITPQVVDPTLTFPAGPIAAGDTVRATVTGCGPNDDLTLTLTRDSSTDNQAFVIQTTYTADATGEFTRRVRVPEEAFGGDWTATVRCPLGTGAVEDSVDFTVTAGTGARPRITLSKRTLAAGDALGVVGTGCTLNGRATAGARVGFSATAGDGRPSGASSNATVGSTGGWIARLVIDSATRPALYTVAALCFSDGVLFSGGSSTLTLTRWISTAAPKGVARIVGARCCAVTDSTNSLWLDTVDYEEGRPLLRVTEIEADADFAARIRIQNPATSLSFASSRLWLLQSTCDTTCRSRQVEIEPTTGDVFGSHRFETEERLSACFWPSDKLWCLAPDMGAHGTLVLFDVNRIPTTEVELRTGESILQVESTAFWLRTPRGIDKIDGTTGARITGARRTLDNMWVAGDVLWSQSTGSTGLHLASALTGAPVKTVTVAGGGRLVQLVGGKGIVRYADRFDVIDPDSTTVRRYTIPESGIWEFLVAARSGTVSGFWVSRRDDPSAVSRDAYAFVDIALPSGVIGSLATTTTTTTTTTSSTTTSSTASTTTTTASGGPTTTTTNLANTGAESQSVALIGFVLVAIGVAAVAFAGAARRRYVAQRR